MTLLITPSVTIKSTAIIAVIIQSEIKSTPRRKTNTIDSDTSCKIEKCKDHTQFLRFYHCKSKMIPFSALEFSLASRNCGRTKEESLYEMEHLLGFSVEEIPECAIMRQFLGDDI